MTLNQVINRIKQICLAHYQLRSFNFGLVTDWLNEKTTKYAGAFLQDNGGSVEITGKSFVINFKLFLLDLVNVSEKAKDNELEVQSDMCEILKDVIAEMNHSSYSDWSVTGSGAVQLVYEQMNDLVAGAVVDFQVRIPYDKDTCAVPTEALPGLINEDDMKALYDSFYTATGAEGTTISIPEMVGKKVMKLAGRESGPIYLVSNAPDSAEFTWNGTVIGLGVATQPGERFCFLWRNY